MAVKASTTIELIRVDDGTNGQNGKMLYGTSTTTAGTAAKVTASNISGFSLYTGVTVSVKFTYGNTATSPTLNINRTGAKGIQLNGAAYAYWIAGATVDFVYDGSYWQVCSTPLYGSSSTIGNPTGTNVYIDGDSVDIRSRDTILSSFSKNAVKIGSWDANAQAGDVFSLGFMNAGGKSTQIGSGLEFKLGSTRDQMRLKSGTLYLDSYEGVYINENLFAETKLEHFISGTSGIWTYRKWSDGTAECWGITTATRANGQCARLINEAFPFTFITEPVGIGILAEFFSNSAGGLTANVKIVANTTACAGWVHSSGSIFDSYPSVGVRCYVIGRWK